MKIAQVSPLAESVPPRLYGGTERVVAHLCDALVGLGHEVTLFAAGDACTQARLVPCRAAAVRLDPQPLKSELACLLHMLDTVRQRMSEFDIIHFHTELAHFPLFEGLETWTLTTLHGRLDIADLQPTFSRWNRYPLTSISLSQRSPLATANWAGNVPHGLDPSTYSVNERPTGEYLAFLGRASPEKGMECAIAIAQQVGIPLRIAAKVDPADRDFFERVLRPLFDLPGIEFLGEIGDSEKSAFLGNALALLFPIDWPEPFGLVMIEAMACGTPVIATPFGAVTEIIDDGVTGFVVRDIDAAIAAVGRAALLDRQQIREVFEQRFTSEVMARSYLDLYRRGH